MVDPGLLTADLDEAGLAHHLQMVSSSPVALASAATLASARQSSPNSSIGCGVLDLADACQLLVQGTLLRSTILRFMKEVPTWAHRRPGAGRRKTAVSAPGQRVAQAFEDLADRYDAWYETAAGRVLFDLELAALRPLLAGTAGPRLEVGVGSGRFAAALGLDVGLDLAEAPLLLAKKRAVLVARGVGEELPFREDAFGVVVLVATLCFAEEPDQLLAEVGRVLRPAGCLVAGLVPLDSAWGRRYEEKGCAAHPLYRHAQFVTVAEQRRLLATAGFRLVESRSTLLQAPTDDPSPSPCSTAWSPKPDSSRLPP